MLRALIQSNPMKTIFTRTPFSCRLFFCLTGLLFSHSLAWSQPTVDYGKSYVNVTKGTAGGSNAPGDILEIRATFVVKAGTAYKCSFTDNIPTGTTYIPGTLRVLTNEGLIFRQWTDAAGDDPGTISGTVVTINLGKGATAAAGGTIKNSDKPSFWGGTCIMVASYRVQINAGLSYGTKVDLGNGYFNYANSSGGTIKTISFSPDLLVLYRNYGMCSNSVGANTILSEYGGTFGSGRAKDRGPSPIIPYIYTPFTTNNPNDYEYGVSNNTSPGGTNYNTVNTWTIPDPHRVFQTWDVIGDHTNATNPLLGNPATDTTAGPGGYMIVLNSAYRTDTAFKDTVKNLCPNTFYQYSAWIRNIGSKGGCDSNGVGAVSGNPAYVPTGPGDSSGVHPNMTFNVNGYDYYTTGDIPYTGQWVLKGFLYQTGPAETQMIIYIRNNAPGGGGNDWTLDDIAVATCSPSIQATPGKPDTLCQGANDTVGFKVSSYFTNYTEWQIEQSVDGGATWTVPGTDTTGLASSGSATPVYNPSTGQNEYSIRRYYRLNTINTLILYRIRVASTAANLSNSNCSFVATTSKIVRAVNCNIILPVSLLSFRGQLQDGLAQLQWISANETADTKYIIERSNDKTHFEPAGSVDGQATAGAGAAYRFVDPKIITGPVYYRIRITNGGLFKYSAVVLLSNSAIGFAINSLVNPFTDKVSFEMTVPGDEMAVFALIDAYGRVVKRQRQPVTKGLSSIEIPNLAALPAGMYVLQVQYSGMQVCKPVLKIVTK